MFKEEQRPKQLPDIHNISLIDIEEQQTRVMKRELAQSNRRILIVM